MESKSKGNLLGPKTAEKVTAGKSYAHEMRAHKITIQAIWRLLLPQLLTYIETEHGDLKKELLQAASSGSTDDLCSLLSCDEFAAMKDSFLVANKINSNFRY